MVVILVLVIFPVLVVSASEKNDFELGKKAFNNNNYQQALDYFERTRNNGTQSVSLTYNLAVTHYKLKQYEQSRLYFNDIRSKPEMTSLAEYNLGLIAMKLKNNEQAIVLFKSVYKNTSKSKLKVLSKKQLENLNYKIKKKKSQRVKSSVSVLAGHSDNVSSRSDQTASGKADNFNVYGAYLRFALTDSFSQGITAKLRYYSQVYSVEKQFDYAETEATIAYNFLSNTYRNRLALFLKKSDLDSQSYQSITGFDAKFRNKISNGDYLTYRLRLEDISNDDANLRYDYLTGTRQRYRIDYKSKNKKSFNRFWYQLELNNRTDTAITSYSPTRHTIRYTYQLKFYNHWKFRAGVEYRKSIYPDKPTKTREDDRIRYLGLLEYKFSKRWKLQGAYEYRDNQSTDPSYTYDRNVYFANLNWYY